MSRAVAALALRSGPARPIVTAVVAVGLTVAVTAAFLLAPRAAGAKGPLLEGEVAIVDIELARNGVVFVQGEPAEGVVDHGSDPVDLVAVTVDDGDRRRLVPTAGSITVTDIAYPESLTGVAVSENGTETATSDDGFATAAARALASDDLRDYLRADGQNQPGSSWGGDYRVLLGTPLGTDHYLLLAERNGNSAVTLTALGADGVPVGEGATVTIGPPYRWNTGFAPAGVEGAQPVALTVVDVEVFGLGSGAIHGFQVDNDDEADIKLLGLAPAPDAVPTEAEPAAPAPADDRQPMALIKTVYPGHDGGVGCDEAAPYLEAGPSDAVTYCFVVTNTGADHLDQIVVDDPPVAGQPTFVSADSRPLAPGHSARYVLETTPPADEADGFVDDTYINTATATAVVVDGAGVAIAGADPATASAEAVVFPAAEQDVPQPGVALVTTIYAGHDGGAGCPAGKSAAVEPGSAITTCYTVTNTGNTHLDTISLDDEDLIGEPVPLRADSQPLAPGDSAYYYLDTTSPTVPDAVAGDRFVASSLVTANSVEASGADLVGLDDVSSDDTVNLAAAEPASTPDPAPQPARTPAPPARAELPTELAYTGLTTWIVAVVGIGLIGAGWLILHPPARPAVLNRVGARTRSCRGR